ncbi:hypothetical protein ONZ51_g6034 [Trametes cubensis]|uniref:C2H2-type domain-containing protein n=1 Tax=Trametes cubensis TaxID=1111947 RepID=A0AAD7TVB0_9APHY|nr:hypothetical protein ONZ51_g6034 [Trametes cubensis]
MSTRARRTCPGCSKSFTITGYSSHLRQTTRLACIAARENSDQADSSVHSDPDVPSRSSSPAEGTIPLGDSDNGSRGPSANPGEAAPVAFEGDYFGSYTAADFDDFDNYEEPEGAPEPEANADSDTGRPHIDPEDEDEEEDDASNFEAEAGWEPPARQWPPGPAVSMEVDEETGDFDRTARARSQEQLRTKTYIVPFPSPSAGAPISRHHERTAYEQFQRHIDAANTNPYAPFTSRLDWELARWGKMRGPGSTALSELLQIENLVTLLGLSYKNTRELNAIIDGSLTSGRPRFIRREVVVADEVHEVFYRDIIECIRALYGDPEFADILVFSSEKHYADEEHKIRVYFDLHTGKWWWETQKELEARRPGATIIPIIISSDKTQLTVFGSKTAYPVYMTIGNLPKDVRRKPSRRGQILLAYLPSTRLPHISNQASRRRTLANLFHACMSHALAPLRNAGIHGVEMTSGDGVSRRGHPIFAMYIGDYPEQLLVTCCKNGTCPKCTIPRDQVGASPDSNHPTRDLDQILRALDEFDSGPAVFSRACRDAGIKPVINPFWRDLPYVNIFRSITPDLLHQLYQGVIKHLLAWLKLAYGPEELDARCRRLPPNHQIRLFMKGITTLQRVTGKEHGDMCRFLLGLVVGLSLPGGYSPLRLVRAVRALLDFLYLSQYPAHTSDTLSLLCDALRRFHANKDIFTQLGIRLHFKLPKLHALDHYVDSIKLFGTTDNYDTQYTERLHIDFAKDAYRATNHKDKFPQMTVWLERREKILRHEAYVNWRLRQLSVRASSDLDNTSASRPPSPTTCIQAQAPFATTRPVWTRIKIARWPSVKGLSLNAAAERYAEVEQASLGVALHFRKVEAYYKLKFLLDDAQQLGVMDTLQDVAHARPGRRDRQGRPIPGRFDTVLINDGSGGHSGVHGYEVAQVRLVFKLPKRASEDLFPDVLAPGHLVYVERFSRFTAPDPVHGMYKVKRLRDANGARLASVFEINASYMYANGQRSH